jgi:hypothetical protein
MKYPKVLLAIGLLTMLASMSACEEVVTIASPQGEEKIVVDGWITDQPGRQVIRLSKSQSYFDNTAAKVVSGANMKVTDSEGKTYSFEEDPKVKGFYVWTPTDTKPMGKIGVSYTLGFRTPEGEEYSAITKINRVPKIDSILYEFEDSPPPRQGGTADPNAPKEGYAVQFYARDFVGEGDCYRIKSYKNGKLFNATSYLALAFDAAQQPRAQADGIMFILPIRRTVSPELFLDQETIKVELQSITEDAFQFFRLFRQEAQNQGLFARPPAQIPTNIINKNPNGKTALGWFGASAVSTFETKIEKAKARKGLS